MVAFLSVIFIILMSVGCATWDGVKKDTKSGWKKTKGAIHDATAPDTPAADTLPE